MQDKCEVEIVKAAITERLDQIHAYPFDNRDLFEEWVFLTQARPEHIVARVAYVHSRLIDYRIRRLRILKGEPVEGPSVMDYKIAQIKAGYLKGGSYEGEEVQKDGEGKGITSHQT